MAYRMERIPSNQRIIDMMMIIMMMVGGNRIEEEIFRLIDLARKWKWNH